jgi:hypothetical protein
MPLWWRRGGWFAPATVLIVVLRWRFLWTPITADEGGYLAEARAWSRGAVLYRDVWVDRPQGLLAWYRLWNLVGLGTPVGVRIMALVACLIGAYSCGRIAARLAGESSAWMAALAVGVLARVPQFEGFIANSELLSCSLGAASLAILIAATWDRPVPSWRLLALAGVVGGCAVSVKQSGFDAFTAGLVAVALMCLGRRWTRRQRILAVPTFVGGLAIPLVALMIHGAVTGWHRWWYAMVGYRAAQRSALRNADWSRFAATRHVAWPILALALGVCVLLAVRAVFDSRHRRVAAFLVLWFMLAVFAFVLGGQFFRHYWVILAFPIGTALGALIGTLDDEPWRMALLVVALCLPMVSSVRAMTYPRNEVGSRLSDDGRLVVSEHIARWFESKARPGDDIYAMCASAALYGNVRTDPPYPYLWFALVPQVPGARQQLVDLMNSPKAPTVVALFQPADRCDPSGSVKRALATRYRRYTTIDGIPILVLDSALRP